MAALAAASLAPSAYAAPSSTEPSIEQDCTFDLYNLCASNAFPQQPPAPAALDGFLLASAEASATQLVAALWELPTAASDEGPLAMLPGSSYVLPRAKTPPEPKGDTRWEQFRKEKGIENRKRGRKEWDEATQEWVARYGKDSRANQDTEWPIMEADRADPYADPWEKARTEKKAKVEKNQVSQTKNLERQGLLPKGSGRKLQREQEGRREQTSAQQEKAKENAKGAGRPAGVPVDMKTTK